MRKQIGAAVALGLAVLAAVAVSGAPSQSRPSLESRLRAFGMPTDGTLAAAGQHNGELVEVWYYDREGRLQHIGGITVEPTPAPDG